MSFTSTSAYDVELERCHSAPAPLAEHQYPYAPRVTRREWQMLLESWERLQPNADRFATVFFDTLFDWEPTLRYRFGGTSLETQFIKFAHLLTELVSVADDPETLEHGIDTIVRRYAGESMADHGRAIRTAITATLADVSLARLTPEMRLWWRSAHATVVAIVRNGARSSSDGRFATVLRNTRINTR